MKILTVKSFDVFVFLLVIYFSDVFFDEKNNDNDIDYSEIMLKRNNE